MKKRHVIALLLCTLMLTACGGGKPKDMDQQTYELGKRAVEITQSWLNAEVSASEAGQKLDEIYDRLDGLDFETYGRKNHNETVRIQILTLKADVAMSDSGKTYDKLKDLKEELNLK